jgi:hypothetical protein
MEMTEELRACLALQAEIANKQQELRRRFKAIIEAERAKGNHGKVSVIIDGKIYILQRRTESDYHIEEIDEARRLGSFWDYQLVLVGKPIE